MAIIVEFIGQSGSGKTTLSQKLVQNLKERGFPVVSRDKTLYYEYLRKNPPELVGSKWLMLKRFFQIAPYSVGKHFVDTFFTLSQINLVSRFEVRYPRLTEIILNNLEHNYHSEEEKVYFLKMIYDVFALYQIIDELHGASDDKSIIILDEGFCRVGRIIYARGDIQPVGQVTSFIDQIILPDLAIHVDADPYTCIERLAVRTKRDRYLERKKQSNPESYAQTLENGRLSLTIMCEKLKSRNVPVYEVANNATLDSSIQLLQEYLDNFLKHKR
jgi:thymidylate kinase